MTKGFQSLVNALESRFDYQSSRVLAREALAKAGLKEEATYSDSDLQLFADGLATVAKRLDRVWAALGVAPSGQPLPEIPAPTLSKLEEAPVEKAVEVAPAVTIEEVAAEVPAEEAALEVTPEVLVEEESGEAELEELEDTEGEEAEESAEQTTGAPQNHFHHNKKKNKNKNK